MDEARARKQRAQGKLAETVAVEELARLTRELNSPHIEDFLEAVRIEAIHQRERWGASSDEGKAPTDWFWLIGLLAGKGLAAAVKGDRDKALHHTISTAAVCLNWHAHIKGEHQGFQPGHGDSVDRGERISQ